MRYVSAQRASIVLTVVFVLAAGAFVWLVGPRSSPAGEGAAQSRHPGAAPYAEYCASCHTVESLRPGIVGADSVRLRELHEFLGRHGNASDAEDRLILEYLRYPAAGQ